MGRICDRRRYERGRARRATGRATYSQLTQAKRAVSKTRTRPREAREPKGAQRKGYIPGRRSRRKAPKYAGPTNEEGNQRGPPRRKHPHTRAFGLPAGTPKVWQPAGVTPHDAESRPMVLAWIWARYPWADLGEDPWADLGEDLGGSWRGSRVMISILSNLTSIDRLYCSRTGNAAAV